MLISYYVDFLSAKYVGQTSMPNKIEVLIIKKFLYTLQ